MPGWMVFDRFIAFARIGMDDHLRQPGKFVEQAMANLFGDEIRGRLRQRPHE